MPRRRPTDQRDSARGRRWCAVVCVLALGALGGCVTPGESLTRAECQALAVARPILDLDPAAVWTDQFNRLVALGPPAVDALMRAPRLARPAAPDDLRVFVHLSLVRLLANPGTQPPQLSAMCLATTYDLLHFDVRVRGQPLGPIVLADRDPPASWLDLFPAEFRHDRAAAIDLEGDRRAVRAWWAAHRGGAVSLVTPQPLAPQPEPLWPLLARRPAARWVYEVENRVVPCALAPRDEPAVLRLRTYDYNLVRAACIWLGSRGTPAVQERLVTLVGSDVPVVAENARFALRFAPEPRIRALIEQAERR